MKKLKFTNYTKDTNTGTSKFFNWLFDKVLKDKEKQQQILYYLQSLFVIEKDYVISCSDINYYSLPKGGVLA